MTAPTTPWQCPLCGRRMPGRPDVCRCGFRQDTDRQDEPQVRMPVAGPPEEWVVRPGAIVTAPEPPALAWRLAMSACGWQAAPATRGRWHGVVRAAFGISLAAVFALTLTANRHEPPRIHGNVDVVSRLEDHARLADPSARNTIPAFLALPGELGVLDPSSPPERVVKPLDAVELAKGLCSHSIAQQVRHEYPGFYESWPDARLERVVLAKYPEYRGRLCVLPSWIDAAPGEIVKYTLKPQSAAARYAAPVLRATLATTAFGLVCLNIFFRLLTRRGGHDRGVSLPRRAA